MADRWIIMTNGRGGDLILIVLQAKTNEQTASKMCC